MLIPVVSTKNWHGSGSHAGRSHSELVTRTIALDWCVYLELHEINAQLAHVGVNNVHREITKVLVCIRQRIAGVFEINHFVAGYIVTGS